MPWLAGTPSRQSLAPAPVPGRDTRCSSSHLDRQGLFASPIAGEADQHRPRRGTADWGPRQHWPGQHAVRRRAAHNGLELSCPAARATVHPFSRNLAGQSPSNFPHASRVSCSELLGAPITHVAGAPGGPTSSLNSLTSLAFSSRFARIARDSRDFQAATWVSSRGSSFKSLAVFPQADTQSGSG